MKLTKTRILLIFLLFHSILSIIHNLSNYEIIEIGSRKKQEFYYEIKYNSSDISHTPFLLMFFTESVQFGAINDETDTVNFRTLEKYQWVSVPLSGIFPIIPINFIVKNDNLNTSAKFIFIDYSKEINLDFEAFINWNHSIQIKIEEIFIPEPIIFNVDKVEKNEIISFNTDADGEIINDTNLLYYCINEGDECIFKELNILTVEKGKQYKFILNPYKNENEFFTHLQKTRNLEEKVKIQKKKEIRRINEINEDEEEVEEEQMKIDEIEEEMEERKEEEREEKEREKEEEREEKEREKEEEIKKVYYFKPIEIDYIIREIELGANIFEIKKNINELFFIVNIKKYEKIYYYVKIPNFNFYYAYIDENQKNNIINELELEYIQFKKENSTTLIINDKISDYFLIKIKNEKEYEFYKGSIFLANSLDKLEDNQSLEIEKGKYLIIQRISDSNDILVSSTNNMVLLESKNYLEELKEPTNYLSFTREHMKENYIFIDSSKEKTKIKSTIYEFPNYDFKFNIILQNDINSIFNKYGPDSIFMRTSSHASDFGFNTSFIFGLEEKYYLYTKKYFGNVDIYQLNRELDAFTNLEELYKPIQSYEANDYNLINNQLLIISGYQIFSFFNSYGSLYDVYMQKFNDLEHVQLNPNMFKFDNLVKIFKRGKQYYLDFTIDHFIKLDSKFLYAEVTFIDIKNNITYKLNEANKVIKNLTGDNIIVKSNEDALVYFYKKIQANSPIIVKDFDYHSGEILYFVILSFDEKDAEIRIIKDFGFKECYPIISERNWEIQNGKEAIILVENPYDKLENNLYEKEGEKFIIYAFDSLNEDNFPIFNNEKYFISEAFYTGNLFTKGNKFNFEVIPPNSENGLFILFSKNKPSITYQLFICENEEINYFISNLKSDFEYNETINTDYSLNLALDEDEILGHRIIANNDCLFAFNFHNPKERDEGEFHEDYSIISINEIGKNIFLIEFSPVYSDSLIQYHIIAAIKDDSNNIFNFSKPCYLANLMIQNSEKIVIKTIFEESKSNKLSFAIDINNLVPQRDDQIVITIISENLHSKTEVLTFYKPIEFDVEKKEYFSFNFDEKIKFDFDTNSRFKFNYTNKYYLTEYLIFNFESDIDFTLSINDGINTEIKQFYESDNNTIEIKLSNSGTYHFQFSNENSDGDKHNTYFIAHIENNAIDTIDLSQKKYINLKQKISKELKEPIIYKVEKIKEDINVIFNYEILDSEGENIFTNPFKICNDYTEECQENIFIYKFEKEYKYTIFINYIRNPNYIYNDDDDENNSPFIFPAYIIYPVFEDFFAKKEEGYYTFSVQKILIIDIKEKQNISIYFENTQKFYYTFINETINKDSSLNSLDLNAKNFNLASFAYYGKQYLIIIPIFKINDFSGIVIIFNQYFDTYNSKYKIMAQNNVLINIENEEEEEDDDYHLDNYNVLKVFSSTTQNMKPISLGDKVEYSNLVLRNYFDIPIYVEKTDEDIEINLLKFEPRYSFFMAIDNNYYQVFKDLLNYGIDDFNINIFPLNLRLNTDLNIFYEYINIYFSGIRDKLNIYIKKLYGSTEFYECDTDPIDKIDFSILTKPLSSCKNKKSLFNRLNNLENSKIISGYLDHDSYFDIYLDIDDDKKTISLSSLFKENEILKNTAKYLIKGVEYNLNISSKYMVRLEPSFNAEVLIYNDNETILRLDSNNLIGKLRGENLKIKSNNNNTMVYFYGELYNEMKQKKIENYKGKNIKITIYNDIEFNLDFGFEGYTLLSPYSIRGNKYDKEYSTFYFENIYDKLQTKLIDGESLYLYYIGTGEVKIEYTSDNINNPKNDYNFNFIQKNTTEDSSLIINNMQYDKIIFQVNFCKNPSDVKMFYQTSREISESEIIFNKEENITYKEDIDSEIIKLRFESDEDFIFSYSFIDETDQQIEDYEKWNIERKELKDLTIKEIILENEFENSKIYSLKFNPNYKNSSTRYIILVAKKDDYNSEENFSNPCHITKLVTEKADGVKIINIYDIGENDIINTNIDLFDIITDESEYIVNIISQELRFEKKLNFYKPKIFSFLKGKKIEIEKEQSFDFAKKQVYFDLQINKKSGKNEMLLLNYKLNQLTSIIVEITGPNGNKKSFDINNQEGFKNFLYDKSGSYKVYFKTPEDNYLKENNNDINGSFIMMTTESAFDLDITKNKIEFEEFNINRDEAPLLQFKFKPKDKDYIKKIVISNIDNTKINEIVSIKKNNEENKSLNFHYYTFEKNSEYIIHIKFNKNDENNYTLEKFNIIDFSSDNIQQISSGNKIFNEINDSFLIIKWKNIKKIVITKKIKEPEFLISNITESQSKNLFKENIQFNKLTNETNLTSLTITKPDKFDYSVLMVEISEAGTEINIEIDKKKDGLSTGYIVLISLISVLVLIILVFFILRCIKKRQNIDFNKKAQEITQEKLLNDM